MVLLSKNRAKNSNKPKIIKFSLNEWNWNNQINVHPKSCLSYRETNISSFPSLFCSSSPAQFFHQQKTIQTKQQQWHITERNNNNTTQINHVYIFPLFSSLLSSLWLISFSVLNLARSIESTTAKPKLSLPFCSSAPTVGFEHEAELLS